MRWNWLGRFVTPLVYDLVLFRALVVRRDMRPTLVGRVRLFVFVGTGVAWGVTMAMLQLRFGVSSMTWTATLLGRFPSCLIRLRCARGLCLYVGCTWLYFTPLVYDLVPAWFVSCFVWHVWCCSALSLRCATLMTTRLLLVLGSGQCLLSLLLNMSSTFFFRRRFVRRRWCFAPLAWIVITGWMFLLLRLPCLRWRWLVR